MGLMEMDNDSAERPVRQSFRLFGRQSKCVSLFLMGAMLFVALSGVHVVRVWGQPRQAAFYLALYFVFFAAVIVRGLMECMELIRENLRERQQLFRSTLGDADFAEKLGRRVAGRRTD